MIHGIHPVRNVQSRVWLKFHCFIRVKKLLMSSRWKHLGDLRIVIYRVYFPCGGSPRYQHCPPLINFLFKAMCVSLSLSQLLLHSHNSDGTFRRFKGRLNDYVRILAQLRPVLKPVEVRMECVMECVRRCKGRGSRFISFWGSSWGCLAKI